MNYSFTVSGKNKQYCLIEYVIIAMECLKENSLYTCKRKLRMHEIIDSLFRYKIPMFFFRILQKKRSSNELEKPIRNIAFLRPGRLGDLLVATPLFHALKSEKPEIAITVICSQYNSILIKHSTDVDTVKVVNFHSIRAMIGLYKWICRNQIDVTIDLTPGFSRTSTLLSYFLRMSNKRTAGMHKGEVARFFDINTEVYGLHIIERNRILLETVLQYQFKSTDFHPLLYSTDKHVSGAAEFTNQIGSNRLIIGINLSAGRKERQWEFDNYMKLASLIRQHYCESVEVILFAHGLQRQWAEEIGRSVGFLVAPSTDILTTAEILRSCKLLFTPDTAFLHLASAVRVPVVGIYHTAGENLIRWRAYGVLTRELVSCHAEDVNEISAESAFTEIKDMINTLEKKLFEEHL